MVPQAVLSPTMRLRYWREAAYRMRSTCTFRLHLQELLYLSLILLFQTRVEDPTVMARSPCLYLLLDGWCSSH